MNIKNYTPGTLKNSVICFLDILGFANEVQEIQNNLEKADEIGKLLYSLKYDKKMLELTEGSVAITVMSDSIIISHEADTEDMSRTAAFRVIFFAKAFQQILLTHPHTMRLSRGYISEGLCYHKDGIIFGPAYQEAYLQESKNPDPKVIIKKCIAEKYIASKTKPDWLPRLTRDYEGPYFIDYLEGLETINDFDLFKSLENSIATAQFKIRALSEKTGVVEKYIWFIRYAKCHYKKYQERLQIPHSPIL